MATQSGDDDFDPHRLYDQFPAGRERDHGSEAGYNTYVRINDRNLFDPAALRDNPALEAFVRTGDEISISFVQFKSSTRESEYSVHKPHLTFNARRAKELGELPEDLDIEGEIERYPGPEDANIGTYVINHHQTLARWKQSVIVMEDGKQAGQIIYKHPEPPTDAEENGG